ncbi:MAG TPA: Ig-like domain-containing protein, partial [Gaiellaceae bacterium]|nr:Ig-like domain-containing protein [Gaiellaceae bacterium]
DPDAPDTGTISFQVCSDSACTAVVKTGSSPAGIANGASGSWTASGLAQGSYYWRAQAQDAAGNQSAWSGTQQFALDTTPPSLPTVSASPADGLRINQPPTLSAVYNDPSGGTGSLTFELCATSSCASPILTNSGTTGSLTAGAAGSWTPSFLFDGVYYWRVQSVDVAGNASGWSPALSFTVDATPPETPLPASPSGLRVRTGPVLAARVDDPTDPGDQARIFVEVCADADCTTILTSGYSGTVPVGTLASWAAPTFGDGTYYWRALAEDILGNRSDWSAARTFIVDTVAPSVPTQGGVGDAALVNRPRLSGTFVSSDPGDSGTLQFQVCADADCATVVASGSSASVAAGGTASWTAADELEDGVYFWRVRSEDTAGNDSDWSPTWSFTLDQTPPGRPQDFSAKITGHVLTLSWRPPAGTTKVRGYALIVNGKKARTLTPTTLKVRIRLLKNDTRTFAVAAVDPAGNMSETTRTIAAFAQRLSLKQIRSATARHHR